MIYVLCCYYKNDNVLESVHHEKLMKTATVTELEHYIVRAAVGKN